MSRRSDQNLIFAGGAKKIPSDSIAMALERQHYSEEVEKHVLTRYELCQRLGKGAFGIVWKVIEKRSRKIMALKKCYDAFRSSEDAQATYREIMYLTEMAGHDNIVRLLQVIKGENNKDVYLVFDYMETDLYNLCRLDEQHGLLQPIHKKYLCYQLLKAVKYLHSADLVHRDIKPSNLLCNRNCHLRLADFGMCRSLAMPEGPSPTLTDYTSTRWYRAPEVLLGSVHYGKGVDMWACGTVLAELFLHRPLFPGKTTMHQIELILQVSGRPSAVDVESLVTPYASTMIEAIPPTRPRSLPEALPDCSAEAVDFINQCIAFSPLKRMEVAASLRHPFVSEFHDPEDEPIRPGGAVRIETDDNTLLRPADYRKKLYSEIERRRQVSRRNQLEMLKRPSQAVLQSFED